MTRQPAPTYNGEPCRRCGKTLRYARNEACVRCQKVYNKAEYRLFTAEKSEISSQWHEQNRDRHNEAMRIGQLRRKFGLTPQGYDALLAKQRGGCAICQLPCPTGRKLAVDHHHQSGRVRGLLCQNCNTGLGKFGDDPDRLKVAAAYLLKFLGTDDIIEVIHSARKAREIPEASSASE